MKIPFLTRSKNAFVTKKNKIPSAGKGPCNQGWRTKWSEMA